MKIFSARYVLIMACIVLTSYIKPAAQEAYPIFSPFAGFMVMKLLDRGDVRQAWREARDCDVMSQHGDRGETVLHSAAANHGKDHPSHRQGDQENILDLARTLLERRADPNAPDADGATPLHYASSGPMTYLLLQYDADSTKQTRNGTLPIDYGQKDTAARTLLTVPFRLPRALSVSISSSSSSSSSSSALSELRPATSLMRRELKSPASSGLMLEFSGQPEEFPYNPTTQLTASSSSALQFAQTVPSSVSSFSGYVDVAPSPTPSSSPIQLSPVPSRHVTPIAAAVTPRAQIPLVRKRKLRRAAAVAASLSLATIMEEESGAEEDTVLEREELEDDSGHEEMEKKYEQAKPSKKKQKQESTAWSEDDQSEFNCATCGRSYKKLGWLVRHERTHVAERPYQCEQCERSFTQKKNFMRHLLLHPGKESFSCIECERSFNQKIDLDAHQCQSQQQASPKITLPRSMQLAQQKSLAKLAKRLVPQSASPVDQSVRAQELPLVVPARRARASSKTRSEDIRARELPLVCPFCDRSFKESIFLKDPFTNEDREITPQLQMLGHQCTLSLASLSISSSSSSSSSSASSE